jgi:threonine dehydrogenase-like Zn-dependent dehydrogenase
MSNILDRAVAVVAGGARVIGLGASVVIDTAGTDSALLQAIELTATGGRVRAAA